MGLSENGYKLNVESLKSERRIHIPKRWLGLGRIVLIISVLFLASCEMLTGQKPESTESEIPPVVTQEASGHVFAEAVVVPARSVTLRFQVKGTLTDVGIAEGETVHSSDSLLRLDPTDTELAIEQAEVGVDVAKAQLAVTKAGVRVEQLAVLKAQLVAAQAAISQTLAQHDVRQAREVEADVAKAQIQIAEAEVGYRQANDAHDDTMECITISLPDGSEREICPGLGTFEEIARANMETAQASLNAAQAQVNALYGVAQAQVNEAEASIVTAQAQYNIIEAKLARAKAGSRAEEITVLEAGVQQAEATLATARAALTYTQLTAPFESTVTDVAFQEGDVVMPGDAALTLATLEHLQIETKDLTELDVVHVNEGQAVLINIDARPNVPIWGHIARIDPQSANYLGDVTYRVVIELDADTPDWLRWGMTAQIEVVEAGAEPDVVSTPDTEKTVIAEAMVEPARWSAVRFLTGGRVVAVPAETGMRVQKGDVLVQLDDTQAKLAVQEAKAALEEAQAQLTLMRAGPQPEAIAAAEARIASAKGEVSRTIALRDQLTAGMRTAQLAAAQAALKAAQAEKLQAQAALRWAEDEGNENKITQARDQLYLADIKISAAQTQLAVIPRVADAQVRNAEAGISAARAQITVAKTELALAQTGNTEEEIAVAEVAIHQAEAALAEAKVAVSRTVLTAPFDGTVTQVFVDVGDIVAPEQGVLILATLDQLQVKTTDLTELDIVHVREGQPVQMTADALPDIPLRGIVKQVEFQSVDYRGDVAYPVIITFEDDPLPELRWGMTMLVTFE